MDWRRGIGRRPQTVGVSAMVAVVLVMLLPPVRVEASPNFVWYLKGDGVPTASLSTSAPTAATLPNYDPERDEFPGLVLAKGGGLPETDPTKHQVWVAPQGLVELNGPVTLTLWSAMKDFNVERRGGVEAGLYDCNPTLENCTTIGVARLDLADWSGGATTWVRRDIGFGQVTYSFPSAQRRLVLELVVLDGADDDMWLAYNTTSYPSRLSGVAPNEPPSFATNLGDRTDAEGDRVELAANAVDPDVPPDPLTFSAVGLPPGLAIDPATGFISGGIDAGAAAGSPYAVQVVVDDGRGGTDTDTFQWTVTETNGAPVLAPVGDRVVDEGAMLSFGVSASDPDMPADGLTFSVEDGPPGAVIDAVSGKFSWMPGEAEGPGSNPVTIRVTDDGAPALFDEETFTVTVNEVNAPPVLAGLVDRVGGEGDVVSLSVSATDGDVPPNVLTFSTTGLPPGLSINRASGVISGTIGVDAAVESPFSVKVVVDDGKGGTDSHTFQWRVTATNRSPVAESMVVETEATTPLNITLVGSDPDGDPVTFAVVTTPQLGILTGAAPDLGYTAHAGAAGVDTFTFSVEDPGGLAATATVTVHISAAPVEPPAPVPPQTPAEPPAPVPPQTPAEPPASPAAALPEAEPVVGPAKVEVLAQTTGRQPPEPPEVAESAPLQRTFVLMSRATTESVATMKFPLLLLAALATGALTVGRISLVPLLKRGRKSTGTVRMFDPEVGYGLITRDEDGEEVFVHRTAIRDWRNRHLRPGERVTFQVLSGEYRDLAKTVRRVKEAPSG